MDAPLTSIETIWTWTFCLLLLGSVLLRAWLAQRQMRFVLAHRHAVPSAFSSRISLAAHQKAADYTVDKLKLEFYDTIWGSALLIVWTLLGGLDALNHQLQTVFSDNLQQQVALLVAFFAINAALEWPLAWWRTFRLEQRHGFNHMTLGLWLQDGLKSALVSILLGVPFMAALLWLIQAMGTWWWLWAWAFWLGVSLLMLVVYPTLIAPLFNRFEPMADGIAKQRIEQLMARCGFRAQGLYVMDNSKRSARANAYFTGFGPAKRVVFFDTLLSKLSADELDAVLAHELGHFKCGHLPRRLLLMSVMGLAAFWLLGQLSTQFWFYTGLGVRPDLLGNNHALALLLFVSVMPLFSFFLTPLLSQVSRRHEFEADAYACGQAQAHDLASALVKLYQDNANTLTPDPWYARFYYSHPPAAERLSRLAISPSQIST